MIIGIEGGLGSGKTILVVRYLYKEHLNGSNIYSNFKLKHIPFNVLNINDVMSMDKEKQNLNKVSIGLDEITVFADCRKSGSTMNRLISYFVLQSRKRDVNLYYTTQNISMVDLRLVNHTDIQIIAEKIYNKNNKEIKGIRRYTIFDLRNIRDIKIKKFVMNISKYYKFYDTKEVILPPV